MYTTTYLVTNLFYTEKLVTLLLGDIMRPSRACFFGSDFTALCECPTRRGCMYVYT